MKVLDYINKRSSDNTINIISKKSIDVLSSENYASDSSNNNANNGGKKNKQNKKGKNNLTNTIYYGKIQYLLKNKKMMSWISEIEILNETIYESEGIKLKKEYVLPELEQIEI